MKVGLVSFPLYLFYQFAKVVTRVSMRIYFKNIQVINRSQARHPHGYIMVSNHPNTLIDVLNTAKLSQKVVHFLANAGLYKSAIGNWIFSTFYCIKVERREDVGNRKINNKEAFQRSYEFLQKGGCLYIAPEGTSWNNRILHPLKTGVARIMFQTVNQFGQQDKICVIPVGLDYSAFGKFRASLLIQVGEPLFVDDLMETYKETPKKAIRIYLDRIREQLEKLSLNCEDENTETRLRTAESILQHDSNLALKPNFNRNKKVLKKIQENPDLKEKLKSYQRFLDENNLSDLAFSKQNTAVKRFFRTIRGLLLLPIFTLATFLTGPVIYFINHITKKYSPHPEYNSTGHILLYLLLLPFYLLLVLGILKGIFCMPTLPIMVLLFSFIPLTVVFREIFLEYGKIFGLWRGRGYCHKYKENAKKIRSLRQSITNSIQ